MNRHITSHTVLVVVAHVVKGLPVELAHHVDVEKHAVEQVRPHNLACAHTITPRIDIDTICEINITTTCGASPQAHATAAMTSSLKLTLLVELPGKHVQPRDNGGVEEANCLV